MPSATALSSMTGFARVEGGIAGLAWVFEAKSVNGKSLDLRCRFANGLEGLEPALRRAAQQRLQRGNIQLSLTLDKVESESRLAINEAQLQFYWERAQALVAQGAAPPRADGLLALRGVVESIDPEDSLDREARDAALLADGERLLDALVAARQAEGVSLEAALRGRLAALGEAVEAASAHAEAQPQAFAEKLRRQVEELLAASPALPEERLAQEAALLAVKGDLREEIERLRAHIAAALALLDSRDAVGRKLDFLCQELNREANTLCSKAQDLALTELGLSMKSIIDQLREQVQNLE
ncbi:MAG: YicC/YloC family endoribonuclease [Pseudomonadota bacterium]